MLLVLAVLASLPVLGYLIGRRRGGEFFVARQRPGLVSFYRVLLIGSSLCLVFCLVIVIAAPAPAATNAMATSFAVLAGIFVLEMLLIGLGLFGSLIFAGRHYPPGHCRRCGYNLHGNRSGRCPECGEPISERPPE
jgi:hypothetical protein